MREIEVKILEVDLAATLRKLRELDAIQEFEGDMVASFFDLPDRMIDKRGDLLRLRQEGPKAVLTYKRKIEKGAFKDMEEYETAVSDPAAMRQILAELGYEVIAETRKHRVQFAFDGVHLVIDTYLGDLAHIPPFVELEAQTEAALERAVVKLGYTMEETKSWDTRDLVVHYGAGK